jgi:hypothetical protein
LKIATKGNRFVDEYGRTLLLRGVNLGGSTKVPSRPDGATWNAEGFFNHRDVSFVGRPFPLDEADEHFSRLQNWGFTFVRFLITWEAIEHEAPGMYDEEYLDYLLEVVSKAGEYGIQLFIDPHQDVWSRFSGGDGAPGWTFEAIGMDLTKFRETGAAITHQEHGDPFPRMIWPSNYGKLANLTMWTLFFGGDDFAPRTTVEGVPVQKYLQDHYIDAIQQVAIKLKGMPNVVGFDTMNEPSAGLIGVRDLTQPAGLMLAGESPSVFQAMQLGAGIPQEVEVWKLGLTGMRKVGSKTVNHNRQSVWLDGFKPIWMQNGVWDVDEDGEPRLLQPEHFWKINGRSVKFYRENFCPFANRYAEKIRGIQKDAIIFVEGVPTTEEISWTAGDAPNIVHAAHWYDILTLLSKNFRSFFTVDMRTQKLVLGPQKVLQTFTDQIAGLIEVSEQQMNNAPTLIGEVGIPFDMKNKAAYRTGDFSTQRAAMDATLRALEANLVSFTLWNYTADNTNQRGDQWNDEDLSIFSRDHQLGSGDINDGGRALEAVLRPYAYKIPGDPLRMSFDIKKRVFDFEYVQDPHVDAPMVFFVPNYQYPEGYAMEISSEKYKATEEGQYLIINMGEGKSRVSVRISPKNP